MFPSEWEMVSAAVARLDELAVEHYLQVPCLFRCIDLVIVRQDITFAVEFKLRDWRKGLEQARDHLLAVDRSVVCLPERRATTTMREAFRQTGVGLSFFSDAGSWPFVEVIHPVESAEKWPVAALWLSQTLVARRSDKYGILRQPATPSAVRNPC